MGYIVTLPGKYSPPLHSTTHLDSRFLSHVASYDAANNIYQGLVPRLWISSFI